VIANAKNQRSYSYIQIREREVPSHSNHEVMPCDKVVGRTFQADHPADYVDQISPAQFDSPFRSHSPYANSWNKV
jgi:hypothetical protein